MPLIKQRLLLLATSLVASFGYAQVKLPVFFSDHMVIQRDQRVPVWGWAAPREKISVRFHAQQKETVADGKGNWRLDLDPESAGGPFELRIQGKQLLVIQDVLVGEVWLCSGQSNMEFELKSTRGAEAEIADAQYPQIRHFKVVHTASLTPKLDLPAASWEICSPQTAGGFTAVGYFFAREISRRLQVPVGIIHSSWGGTMVETWTSRGAFENSPEFKSLFSASPDKDMETRFKEMQAKKDLELTKLLKSYSDTVPETQWKNPDYNGQDWPKISVARTWESQSLGLGGLDGIIWYRKEIILDAVSAKNAITVSLGKIDDFDDTYVNGIRVGGTKSYSTDRIYPVPAGVFKEGKNVIAVRVEDTGGGGGFYGDSTAVKLITETGTLQIGDAWQFRIAKISGSGLAIGPNDYPCLLFNAMINPLIPYAIRGVLWYQGEANADRAFQYRTALPLMISDWRQKWGAGDFPFYLVQLASFNSANGNSQRGSTWAELREAQTLTLKLPNTGMSVTTDIGESNDIHPKNKRDVGLRLARIALNNIYGKTMEYSGPVYTSQTIEGNKVILTFQHTGSGLMVKNKYGYIMGFEIAGADHQFHFAKAYLKGNQVVVYADEVKDPVSVHYAWADDAGDANLYNQEGLPAIPFRTDQWPGITDGQKFSVGSN